MSFTLLQIYFNTHKKYLIRKEKKNKVIRVVTRLFHIKIKTSAAFWIHCNLNYDLPLEQEHGTVP